MIARILASLYTLFWLGYVAKTVLADHDYAGMMFFLALVILPIALGILAGIEHRDAQLKNE